LADWECVVEQNIEPHEVDVQAAQVLAGLRQLEELLKNPRQRKHWTSQRTLEQQSNTMFFDASEKV
jgi:hypothetical protein